ncbi:conserved hypothetical protein [Hahella chejuensis KCTC 2396]|uniref:DUF1449 domain-containing protein n=1 Tax=Hahella chejuensis (strain KCTC 2396) TaxID=349521 RepID=Q2SN99_HAHCH|nr:hypothetical protein [Hahella chejuensis]ABC27875.1 conserved hypothetical protein [Hahella chejuensis KCTC 2396]
MEAYLATIFSFPTVVFTVLLGIVVCYWILAIIGLLDLDPFDLDLDLDVADAQGLAGLMVTLGLTGVPLPLVLSFLAMYGWLLTYFVSLYILIPMFGGVILYIAGAGVIAIAFGISILLTAKSIRPLRPLFRKAYGTASAKVVVIGRTGTVRSGSISETFGEAEITIDGAHLILKVRGEAGLNLKRGDKVIFIKYLEAENAYQVMPEEDFLADS